MNEVQAQTLFIRAKGMLFGVIDLLHSYAENYNAEDSKVAESMYNVLNIVESAVEKLELFESETDLQIKLKTSL